jgi:hypothetical protein
MSRIYHPTEFSKVLSVSRSRFTPFWTDEGGLAVPVLFGEDLSKGMVVTAMQGAAYLDRHVYKVPTSGNELDMPCAIVYQNAYKFQIGYVVTNGLVYVLPVSTATATRGYIGYIGNSEAGRVEVAAAVPAVTSHNREICHWFETASGAGVLGLAFFTHAN